ncbi:hypothetical protein AWZ03_010018 [Drosophila navojoa]|uniref:Uncharacterized protein n=1 Tax=Drosophila navojoa TaxID=7232 RepID=A0A484B471_DRONA|nr:hypothetical protein AWZ03_010018 [Drosophila navojoa]
MGWWCHRPIVTLGILLMVVVVVVLLLVPFSAGKIVATRFTCNKLRHLLTAFGFGLGLGLSSGTGLNHGCDSLAGQETGQLSAA